MNPNDTNQNPQKNQSDWQSSGNMDPNLAQPYNPWNQDTLAQNIEPNNQTAVPQVPPTPSTQPVQTPTPTDVQAPNNMQPQDNNGGSQDYDLVPRDPNVLNFMVQAVQQKHGVDADPAFVKKESERLYDEFGEKLVDYFEPMLSKEQIEEFDKMMTQGASQDQLLAFLMSSIPDLTQQIEKVLIEYKEKYIYGF